MSLKAKVAYPRIDISRSEEEIHGVMVDAVVDAAKTWVIATTDAVPVYTGASKASFLKLAALARTQITISPKVKDRIRLGISTSVGILNIEKGKSYGFQWQSDLPYIHIVDDRSGFLSRGEAAIRNFNPILPNPIIVSG